MEQVKKLLGGKRLLSVGCGLAAIVLAAGTLTFAGTAQENEEAQTVYREDTVQRGDLVVGVSETATATLKSHTVSVDIDAVIDYIYVKAGQAVSEGDVIASLDTEELEEELYDLQTDLGNAQMDLVTAQVNLTSAQLDLQIQELSLQNSYDTTVAQGETAQTTYDLTVESLELQVTQARNKVTELQKQVNTYTKMLANITGDYADYTAAYEDYASALSAVNKAEAAKNQAYSAYRAANDAYDSALAAMDDPNSTVTTDELAELKEKRDDLLEEYTQAQQNYTYALGDYDDAYYYYNDLDTDYSETYANLTDEDEIRELRNTARDNLTSAKLSLTEAETNLALKKLEAEQTLKGTLSDAENADVTYELKVQQMEYTIQARELEIQNSQKKIEEIEKKIAEVRKYLADSTLVAPCDGLVASISYNEGDEVKAKATILTISDSTNAYVYVAVAQDDIGNISIGQEATLELDAFDAITFTGAVDSISTSPVRAANGSANYNVTIMVEGDTSNIFEGMTGTCTLITRQESDVLYVSYRTVYEKDGQSYVKVKTAQGEIVETPVTTGFSDGRNVAVLEGLQEGQTVLIESQVQAQ